MPDRPTPERPAEGLRVAVFGFDVAEASQIRRIRGLQALGCRVTGFCQRRGPIERMPDWPNVDLGLAAHNGFLRRGLGLFGGIRRALTARRSLARSDLVIARNLDLALIALGAGRITALAAGRRPAPFVYECLDIHGLLTRKGPIGAVMRWIERRVLARTDLLVISSPAFLSEYFAPRQGYRGAVAVVENKLQPKSGMARPRVDQMPDGPQSEGQQGDAPLVLGLVGSIRCQPSVDLLFAVKKRMGARLRLRFAGNLHDHAVHGFEAALARAPDADWSGPYAYPEDLPAIYRSCDLVWAQDLWQAGENSDWLLPNRIYEASWCGCPQIALAGTETGRRIARDRLGYVIDAATPEALAKLLESLDRKALQASRKALLARPAQDFAQSPEDLMAMLTPALRAAPALRPVPNPLIRERSAPQSSPARR